MSLATDLADATAQIKADADLLHLLRTGARETLTGLGAVGDGVTINDTVIQTGLDQFSAAGGAAIFVPPVDRAAGKYYRITKPITLPDNIILYGAGYNSLIRNDREVNEEDGDMACVSWAGYSGSAASPLCVESETFYACNDVTRAAPNTITTTTASDAANFAVGDIVFVRNSTALDDQTVPGTGLPAHFQHMSLNEVVAVDTLTGAISLMYSLDYASSGMKIAKSSGTLLDAYSRPIKVRRNTGLANMALACHWNQSKGCFVWGGAFRFFLHNLWLEGADGLTMQMMSRGTITDIRANIGSKLWDTGYYTSHVYIDRVHRTQRVGDFFLAPHGPQLEIDSGTYDAATGEVVLTMAEVFNETQLNRIEVGGSIKVSGLTGTGALTKLQGVSVVTFSDGDTKIIKYVATGGLGATTITGGIARVTAADELCIIGQGAHNLTIGHLTIDAGTLDRDCLRVGRARRVKLDVLEIIAPGGQGVNRPLILGGTDHFGVDGFTIGTVIVRCGDNSSTTPWSAVHLNGSDTEATPEEWNTIDTVKVYGSPNFAIKGNYNAKKWRVREVIAPGLPVRNDTTDPTSGVVVLGGHTLTTNYPVHEAPGTALTTKGADTVAKTYSLAASGASETGGWVFRASGVATTAAGAGTRFIKLLFDSTTICQLDLETSMSGTAWSIEARVLMAAAADAQRATAVLRIDDAAKTVRATAAVNITTAKDFTLNYQLDASDTSIVLDTWEVAPFGHEVR